MLYPTNSHYIPFHVCWRRRGSPSRISATPQCGHWSSFFPSRQEMVMGPDMSRVANPTVAILAKPKGCKIHSWSNLIRFWVWSSFNPVSTHLEALKTVQFRQLPPKPRTPKSDMLRRPVELPVSRNVDTFLSDWYTMCIPFVSCWYTKMPYVSVPIFRI